MSGVTYRAFTDPREKTRLLVEFLKGQEQTHYLHVVNRQRYETLLRTLPNGTFRDQIIQRLAEVIERIVESEAIIAATQPQIPDDIAIDDILAEIREERAAARKSTP